MSSVRQWVWSDELVTLFEQASGSSVDVTPPLIGYAIVDGMDIGTFAKNVVGIARDETTDPGEPEASP